jgi:hypothetical protein
MMKKILALLLVSSAAVAGFYPVNRGMINQATVATVANGTTSFVATQNQVYIAEGSNIGETYKFPNAQSLPKDWWYQIINNSAGTVTASDNTGASITTLLTGRAGYFQLTDNSTIAGTWKYSVPVSLADLGNYFTKAEHISTSAGVADAAKPIVLNGSGQVDISMLPGGGGYTAIGALDGGIADANGANGPAATLYMQSASQTFPGLVNTSAQSFSGAKTFLAPPTLSGIASSILKTDSLGSVTASIAGTDYLVTVTTSNILPGAVTGPKLGVGSVDLAGSAVAGLLPNANIANPSTTVNGVTCTLGSSCSIAAGGSPTSIGTIDSQAKSANGLVTSSTVLFAQTADASFPGMVSTGTQTLAGNKTFNGTVNLNTVTASRFLRVDASKNVTSSLINLANSTNDITGTLAVGNGGTGATGTPTNGQIPIGNGSVYVPATITAGSGITVTNSAGSITINSTATGGGGTGSSLTKSITQANSFSVGDAVYFNSTTGLWTGAKSDVDSTSEGMGIVTTAGNPFTLTQIGYATGLSGLVSGSVYYLSDVTASVIQIPEPVTVGHISKPMFFADSTTSGYVLNMRGQVVTAAASTGSHVESVSFGGSSAISLCTGSPCTIYQSSSGISSVTNNGSGVYTINFVGGTWSTTPRCVWNSISNDIRFAVNKSASTSSYAITAYNTSVATANSAFDVICTQ